MDCQNKDFCTLGHFSHIVYKFDDIMQKYYPIAFVSGIALAYEIMESVPGNGMYVVKPISNDLGMMEINFGGNVE